MVERLVAGRGGARLVSGWLAGSGSGEEYTSRLPALAVDSRFAPHWRDDKDSICTTDWTMSAPTAAILPLIQLPASVVHPSRFTARG